MPKVVKKLMGEFHPTEYDIEASNWCIRNGVKISPLPTSKGQNPRSWHVVIEIGKKVNKSPEAYGPSEIWEKMAEFKKYYYEKHRDRV